MGLPQTIKRYTPEEYYRLERDSLEKHDYYQGEIYPTGRYAPDVSAMAGGSRRHSRICSNLLREIGNQLKGGPCSEYESNLRLKIKANGLRTYPDASVYCGPLERDDEDTDGETYTNPTVVFEVLSASTAPYDRGFKAESYKQIETLKAFVFVAQDVPRIEVFERNADGSWQRRDIVGLTSVSALAAIGVEVPLSDIYDRVEFTSPQI